MNAIGRCRQELFEATPYCAQRPNRQRDQEPHIAGTQARGRQLRWKPLTRASDHALKLPVSPQVLAALWSLAL